MTAIFGIWRYDGDPDPAEFDRLQRSLARYGRNDLRTVAVGSVRLGRHLHVTLPEDRHDQGPVVGERYVVCADARLTERDALTAMLALGPAAAGMSDAAIGNAALETWHEAAKRSCLRALCFEQGLAAQVMLRQRGTDSTLFYGVAPGRGKPLAAHVWVRDRDVGVVGTQNAAAFFVPLASFPPRRSADAPPLTR